jgi:hypothetical protein
MQAWIVTNTLFSFGTLPPSSQANLPDPVRRQYLLSASSGAICMPVHESRAECSKFLKTRMRVDACLLTSPIIMALLHQWRTMSRNSIQTGMRTGTPLATANGYSLHQDEPLIDAGDDEKTSSRQSAPLSASNTALLDRAHGMAKDARLVSSDPSAPEKMSPAEKKAYQKQQKRICLTYYRSIIKAIDASKTTVEEARTLAQIEAMLAEVLDEDDRKFLPEACDLILAAAEFDALYRDKLEYAHGGFLISRKRAWDFVAGVAAFALSFGVGSFLSKAYGTPWISFAINPLTWTLAERLPPLIRLTTWSTQDADVAYPKMSRAAIREATSCCIPGGAPRVHSPTPDDPDREIKSREFLRQQGGFRRWRKAWWKKCLSDDVPYHFYGAFYAGRNILWDSVVRSPEQRAQLAFLNAVTHCMGGCLAGGSTMLTMQITRERQCRTSLGDKYKSAQKLTETPEIQRAKLKKLQADKRLLERKLAQNISPKELLELQHRLELRKEQINDAQARSNWRGLIWAEMTAGLQLQWRKDYAEQQFRGEVPGKLFDTVCALLGKYLSLLQYTLIVAYVDWFKFDSRDDIGMIIAKQLLLGYLLIGALGFAMRTDFTLLMIFLARGPVNVFKYLFGCTSPDDKPETLITDPEKGALFRSNASFRSVNSMPSVPSMSSFSPVVNSNGKANGGDETSNDEEASSQLLAARVHGKNGATTASPYRATNGQHAASTVLIDDDDDEESEDEGQKAEKTNGARSPSGASTSDSD